MATAYEPRQPSPPTSPPILAFYGGFEEGITIRDLATKYLLHAKKHLAPRTFLNNQRYVNRFVAALGEMRVADLRPFHMSDWITQNYGDYSDWAIYNTNRIVQRIFNWAVLNQFIPLNPIQSVSYFQGERRKPVTLDEFKALLRATRTGKTRKTPRPQSVKHLYSEGAQIRQLLLFLRFTGCRRREGYFGPRSISKETPQQSSSTRRAADSATPVPACFNSSRRSSGCSSTSKSTSRPTPSTSF